MNCSNIMVMMAIGTMAVPGSATAQATAGRADGTAIVKVETEPPGTPVSIVFSGVPEGTASAGGSIEQTGLAAGSYTAVASATVSELVLVSITCSDGNSTTPSSGTVQTRTATFIIDNGETVSCIFLYTSKIQSAGDNGPSGPGGPSGASGPDGPGEPGGLPGARNCVPPDLVPKAGRWQVSNLPGRMVCGSIINMPLMPSQESGIIEIRDCGWTVIGTGMAADTAPLTMRAVDASSGRYTGSVGGAQDGIPMTIEFGWTLNSDESIVGDLKSQVSQQGMTCIMSRPFELIYSGP